MPDASPGSSSPRDTRRNAYEPPSLSIVGTLAQLTLQGGSGTLFTDSGNVP